MSARGNRSQPRAGQGQGWSLFPPALNIPSNHSEMNLHQPRRLSPIPRSDDQESEYGGAEVRDIPFYRPSRKSLDKASFDVPRSAGATHDLSALVSPTGAPPPLQIPTRTSSMHTTERDSAELTDILQQDNFEPLDPHPKHLQERPNSRNQDRDEMPLSSYPRDKALSSHPSEKPQYPKEHSDSRSRHRRAAPVSESLERPDYPQERSDPGNRQRYVATPPEPFQRMEYPARTDSKDRQRRSPLDPLFLDHPDYPQERSRSRGQHQRGLPSGLQSPSSTSRSISRASERTSYQTDVTSLAPLQTKSLDENDGLEPLNEEDLDPGSFDLVAPVEGGTRQYSLETRSELLFSKEHLETIFADPSLLLRFTSFLSSSRSSSIPILIYYLDAIKALKAISYSNAIAEALEPMKGFDFTNTPAKKTINADLEAKAKQAFDVMVREDLPAFITHAYIQTVSLSIQRRITGTLPPHLREASEGLAEVFCLTDPSRPDNPIVFASEEFHRTTQYGMSYVIGRNCRFLQGPKTNPHSVRRLRDTIDAGKEHCELFLNYRRDGSPFMNLLMCAPLCDSRGTIRYFIGAQVDVSGLVKECSDMESLRRLVIKSENSAESEEADEHHFEGPAKDEFQELSEMLNLQELDTVRRWGGRMHKEHQEESQDNSYRGGNWSKPRVVINSGSPEGSNGNFNYMSNASGKLRGIYENYLLVRPYPSLRILFSSPTLRVPGILQSPLMAKIGGSDRVRQELTQALADGRGVTAKVKWVSKQDTEGRNRWIHCTPLLGNNGAIGVWMVIVVDDEQSQPNNKRFKMAPPVDPKFGRSQPAHSRDDGSLRDFALSNGSRDRENGGREHSLRHANGSIMSNQDTERSGSPYTLRID